MAAPCSGEARPARAEHAQEVAVGEDDRVAVHPAQVGDDAVGARADPRGVLAVRAAVVPEPPARVALADLGRRESLVLAVVPLAQLVVDLAGPRTRRAARVSTARESGLESTSSNVPRAQLRRRAGARPRGRRRSAGGRSAGVAPVPAPLGLPVADEEDLVAGPSHGRVRARRPPRPRGRSCARRRAGSRGPPDRARS